MSHAFENWSVSASGYYRDRSDHDDERGYGRLPEVLHVEPSPNEWKQRHGHGRSSRVFKLQPCASNQLSLNTPGTGFVSRAELIMICASVWASALLVENRLVTKTHEVVPTALVQRGGSAIVQTVRWLVGRRGGQVLGLGRSVQGGGTSTARSSSCACGGICASSSASGTWWR